MHVKENDKMKIYKLTDNCFSHLPLSLIPTSKFVIKAILIIKS
jgi:hypothetical protein